MAGIDADTNQATDREDGDALQAPVADMDLCGNMQHRYLHDACTLAWSSSCVSWDMVDVELQGVEQTRDYD